MGSYINGLKIQRIGLVVLGVLSEFSFEGSWCCEKFQGLESLDLNFFFFSNFFYTIHITLRPSAPCVQLRIFYKNFVKPKYDKNIFRVFMQFPRFDRFLKRIMNVTWFSGQSRTFWARSWAWRSNIRPKRDKRKNSSLCSEMSDGKIWFWKKKSLWMSYIFIGWN